MARKVWVLTFLELELARERGADGGLRPLLPAAAAAAGRPAALPRLIESSFLAWLVLVVQSSAMPNHHQPVVKTEYCNLHC